LVEDSGDRLEVMAAPRGIAVEAGAVGQKLAHADTHRVMLIGSSGLPVPPCKKKRRCTRAGASAASRLRSAGDRRRRRQRYLFRYLSWQALQALPVSPSWAFEAAGSPFFATSASFAASACIFSI